MAIRILIVDDQPLVRAGIAMLLAAEDGIDVVGECGDGGAALVEAARLQPDVVLMDVRMPGMSGVDATRRLTADAFAADPDRPAKVIILTTYHVDEAVHDALRAGASGFLLKDAAPAELVLAVRAVAAGEAWLDPAVTRSLLGEFTTRPEPARPSPAALAGLTARERETLVLVAHGLSNTEIAGYLYIGESTVKTHLGRVLMKLGLRDRAQAVMVAYQSGLVRPDAALPARQNG
ncbi:DNA-binding NarL/FixJ family response regulator [Allocatelliglobosispora scoriae]|uniref:DNA-binding NarL/FixJ family response regulator n=1 Tax=Allocatelliglobosispora scoriae TaxID=643052 RepID=A0A841BWY9_9ACTN|nr:response regulator transcription factor [Allocatelliglobosispora scoriae]MBB5872674.1 DNA-binding NarL/FixJ family response regulator [Allocatelliglobosispora scoriae]